MATVTKETKHGVIIVDEQDADLLYYATSAVVSGHIHVRWTARVDGKQVMRTLSHLVMERVRQMPIARNAVVFHANGNTLDNRRTNLGAETFKNPLPRKKKSDNGLQSNNRTGYTGVSKCGRTGRYVTYVTINGIRKYAGRFSDPKEAYDARLKAIEKGDVK